MKKIVKNTNDFLFQSRKLKIDLSAPLVHVETELVQHPTMIGAKVRVRDAKGFEWIITHNTFAFESDSCPMVGMPEHYEGFYHYKAVIKGEEDQRLYGDQIVVKASSAREAAYYAQQQAESEHHWRLKTSGGQIEVIFKAILVPSERWDGILRGDGNA